MTSLALARAVSLSAVEQVRQSIALLKSLRADAKDADTARAINVMISQVHHQVKAIVLPSAPLRARFRDLATTLRTQIDRIKLLEKVQRGTVGKNALQGALLPLKKAMAAWRLADVDHTGLTDEISLVLDATAGDFADHIAQVNSTVGIDHAEYPYQLNTARVERLLAVMGEVSGLCAVYGSEPEPLSPDAKRSVEQNRAKIDNSAITSPLEEEFQNFDFDD